MKHAGKTRGKRAMSVITEYNSHYWWNKTQKQIKEKENMKKINKTENQIISVPSATKSVQKTTRKTKPAKKLTKSPSVHSKENTIAYYKCMIDKVANSPAKITQQARECKCTKKEVAQARQEHKKQLVRKVAQDYLVLGENLGHYLHADIVGCAKELKQK